MNHDSNECWRKLTPGDRIRIVRIPSCFSDENDEDRVWEETISLYRELISKRSILFVSEIDQFGRPWIEFETLDSDGTKVSHSLAIDDDSWEIVVR